MNQQLPQGLFNTLSRLGLNKFYPNKLTLRCLLEINKDNINTNPASSLKEIPWYFLKNLLQINAECRSCVQLPANDEEDDDLFSLDLYTEEDTHSGVNALDLIVALFLCADSFLQQEMALRMSMCQFSVPLLLPHSNNSQCSLMLWALRGIVKEWRPHSLTESKGFIEDTIVEANIPLFSFVRLKNSSLSKSQMLNLVLSRGQQSHNIFMHKDMEDRAIKKEIANGLVEVFWYLPCGRENLDIFPEPVAFANLRGDFSESLAQFSFLVQVSTATFVFLDKVEEKEQETLSSFKDFRRNFFLVVNRKEDGDSEDMKSVKRTIEKLDLPKNNVIRKNKTENRTYFSKKLSTAIKTSLESTTTDKMTTDLMYEKATELGLSVDESKSDEEKKAAEEIVKEIGEQSIPKYKKLHLPLQGENWKRLSKLEIKVCRLNEYSDLGTEEYKSQLQEEKTQITEEQARHNISKGMKSFIDNLFTGDKEKRDFFLKWMKLKLDAHSREKLLQLRNQFKEQCKTKDAELIKELDQTLLESSLGIEHFMREMGLIYEFSQKTTEEISRLPQLAAEMVMDGHPLELLDGDASNIPEKWVSAVLNEVHKKVGNRSRLLVLTVLGVQSSGKSTLLNTMFGVQFPVSSGRCTRGAYMIFLRVQEDLKNELNYDFLVLIDTEGLKSADLAQLEDSYEHDNQLATFVIGLSDIAIINTAMENVTEMKDILQIAVHAFLRMTHVGKKPACHFVHQNVAGVSADSKCIAERKRLLDQLNEMTQIASEMEKLPTIKQFTDVLDYDMEKNNWNIPGLWHGTPPMAPVNTGYSETVADFKKNLLETIKSNKTSEPTQIPEFLEWITSLWRTVKYENFIFSFRNTLVAHAYDNLCKAFNQWEWEFRKEIYSWQQQTEVEILNIHNDSGVENWNKLVSEKKDELSTKTQTEQMKMKEKLNEYYKRKDRRVNLIEKYKVDFFNSINSLVNEIGPSVRTKLDRVLELKVSQKKAQEIQRKYRVLIEENVMRLLCVCKMSNLSEDQLTKEFEKMWSESTANVSGLEERDIAGCVLKQLKKNFFNRNVNQELQNTDLKQVGRSPFTVTEEHVDRFKAKFVDMNNLQIFTNNVIESCTEYLTGKVKTPEDYHDSFMKDLLEKIDKNFQQNYKEYETNTKYEIDLKLHICGIASREFLEMHQKFLSNLNPQTQLEKYKPGYLSDFIDLYKERDHCQRKANDYIEFCIRPAVEDFISRSLGVDVVDEILTSHHSAEYSSRSFFQYSIQKELLEKDDFECFVKYINNYEIYVKNWIFQHIQQEMRRENTLSKLKNNKLQVIIKKVTAAIEVASRQPDGATLPNNNESIKRFVHGIRENLNKDLTISVEAEKTILFQIQSTCHPFINSVKMALENLTTELQELYLKSEDINETVRKLTVKPQDELFKRVFGCGKQCPFCKAPCEAGGKDHELHSAAIHRPQGLGRYRHSTTKKLVERLCTTDVQSDTSFCNSDTKGQFHPYKEYTTYYPDWQIPPDPTIEASDYWKYILVKYNDQFAEEYGAKPADVPDAWKKISKEDALKGLKDAFNIK
ncbi:up-regulator of cell proliferation-like [Xiphophorus hellerii]|uniref:up-regulator of cell proliferation-like n=1 Tax=Xiphophorus hellerii TaxID=8084 RepID=UPI0013B4412A|nr:up-regulator of cell proliferation-like [Xiphophorus hellerii]XP_032416656.1 up-regulator of cell proliferation-like [Xiphophorus hellerii]